MEAKHVVSEILLARERRAAACSANGR